MLGHLLEGVVEKDPLTGDFHLVVTGDGRAVVHRLQDLLAKYEGKEVRLTLASFEDLVQLAALAENLSDTGVYGITPDQLPKVPFNSKK